MNQVPRPPRETYEHRPVNVAPALWAVAATSAVLASAAFILAIVGGLS